MKQRGDIDSEKSIGGSISPKYPDIPNNVTLEDKSSIEQMNLIKQLDDDDSAVVFKIIVTMLTKKKFKDLFQKNVAAL
jgi:hypothetical protein